MFKIVYPAVHETLSFTALVRALSSLNEKGKNPFSNPVCANSFKDGIISGVIYSDMPDGLKVLKRVVTNVDEGKLTKEDMQTLTYRSPFGDLSFWHSMAAPGWTGKQTYSAIKKQAKEWFD